MTKFFLFSHPFPIEFSSAVAKAMAGQAGSLDPSTGSGSVDPHRHLAGRLVRPKYVSRLSGKGNCRMGRVCDTHQIPSIFVILSEA